MSEETEPTTTTEEAESGKDLVRENLAKEDLAGVEPTVETNSKTAFWVKLFIVICLVGLMLLAGALYYVIDLGKQELQTVKQEQESRVSELDAIKQQTEDLSGAEQGQQAIIKQLTTTQETLQEGLTALVETRPDSNLEWALNEVEQLIIIAIQRLQLSHDVVTATIALETADTRLKDLADPRLISIREQLTKDINALKAVNPVDVTGLSLYLADLISRVDSLPLKQSVVLVEEEQTPILTGSDETQDWKEKIQQLPMLMWHEIKTMVVIKRKEEQGNTFLLPEEEYYLYQNLRLQLENARLSVLSQDTDNLHSSVEIITSWMQKYFDTGTAAVSNVLETLAKMKSVELSPELPDINSSLETLRASMHEENQETGN